MKFSDYSEYEGDFKDNLMQGGGIYKWQDGRVYEGEWKENKMDGVGKLKYPNEKENDK